MNIKIKKDTQRGLAGRTGKVLETIKCYDGKDKLVVAINDFVNSHGYSCKGYYALVSKEEVED